MLWVSLTASQRAVLAYGETHYTYAHLSCRIHMCKAVVAHAIMHKWIKRGWQLWMLPWAPMHKVNTASP